MGIGKIHHFIRFIKVLITFLTDHVYHLSRNIVLKYTSWEVALLHNNPTQIPLMGRNKLTEMENVKRKLEMG